MNLPFQLPLVTVDDFSDAPSTLTHHSRLRNVDDEFPVWIGWQGQGHQYHQHHHHHLHHHQTDSGVDDENDDDDDDDDDDNGDDNIVNSNNEKVVLPPRYCRLMKTTKGVNRREFSGGRQNVISGNDCDSSDSVSSKDDDDDDDDEDDDVTRNVDESYSTMECRERDLKVALKWIRQEMIHMRRQNRSLLKQFTDIRAGILQLSYASGVTHGSLSDLSSVDGSSTTSLNDNGTATPLNRLTVGHEYYNGLSAGKKSVSLPSSPMVVRSRRVFGKEGGKLCESVWDVDRVNRMDDDSDVS